MNRRVIAFIAVLTLVVAGAALAQPLKVNLHPIADDFPNIRGAVSIECNTITGTVYTVSVSNLPANNFTLVLTDPEREDFNVGSFTVVERGVETVSTFRILMPCPVGTYQNVRIMNGTRVIMSGDLPS